MIRRWAVALSAALVLAACTSSDPVAPDQGGRTEVAPSGTVTFGVLGEPATLDPYHRHASDLTFALTAPLYPALFKLTPDGKAQPFLATDVENTDGGVTVDLADMHWSDGSPITAEDVVATWKRASLPSGLALFDSARVEGDSVRLSGDVKDPELALAIRSPILPAGRSGRVFGGPFTIAERIPGLEIVLEANPEWSGEGPGVERLVVQHVASLDIMLGLLEDGRLDAADVPSTVNLGERLERSGLEHLSKLGWGAIVMTGRLDHLAAAVDRDALAAGLIRTEGRISDTTSPDPGRDGASGPGPSAGALPSVIPLAVPEGDELMFLLQRAITLELADSDLQVELWEEEVSVHYGPGTSEGGVSLVRSAGDPLGLSLPQRAGEPLFHVETFIAYRDGLQGIEVNPTVAGPLWNAERWSKR